MLCAARTFLSDSYRIDRTACSFIFKEQFIDANLKKTGVILSGGFAPHCGEESQTSGIEILRYRSE